jgi:hypothetical protein
VLAITSFNSRRAENRSGVAFVAVPLEAAMSDDRRSVLEVLRYELNFLEQGGYNQKIADSSDISPFQSNLSCLNFGEPLRPHACHECLLYDFVPVIARTEDVPCHHIPLDPAGHTIARFLSEHQLQDLKRALKVWLRRTIADRDRQPDTSAKASR